MRKEIDEKMQEYDWGLIKVLLLLVGLLIGAMFILPSCKLTRHVRKESYSVDTSKVTTHSSESELTIDSSKDQRSTSNIDFTDSTITHKTDDYEQTRIDTYAYDTNTKTNRLVSSETKTKGKKTETKHANKKKTTTTIDSASHKNLYVNKTKEADSTSEKGTATSDKKTSDGEAKTTFGGTALIVGIILIIFVVLGAFIRYQLKRAKNVIP